MAATLATKRLMKEMNEIKTKGTPPGIALLNGDNLQSWTFSVAVLGEETVYRGETFAIRLKFGDRYPIDPPQVTFLVSDGYKSPEHPHCYTNGHICASILGTEWSPVLNAVAVCITMQSMLASCKKKQRPPDNDRYVRFAPKNPQDTQWAYHDDDV